MSKRLLELRNPGPYVEKYRIIPHEFQNQQARVTSANALDSEFIYQHLQNVNLGSLEYHTYQHAVLPQIDFQDRGEANEICPNFEPGHAFVYREPEDHL